MARRGYEGVSERGGAAKAGGGGTAEDEGGGGVHCGFIPANTFIMADLAEPVTHCRGYISASIPTPNFLPLLQRSLFTPPPPHHNSDRILAGISCILTKPLFFNDSLTLSAIREAKGYWIVYDVPCITFRNGIFHDVITERGINCFNKQLHTERPAYKTSRIRDNNFMKIFRKL